MSFTYTYYNHLSSFLSLFIHHLNISLLLYYYISSSLLPYLQTSYAHTHNSANSSMISIFSPILFEINHDCYSQTQRSNRLISSPFSTTTTVYICVIIILTLYINGEGCAYDVSCYLLLADIHGTVGWWCMWSQAFPRSDWLTQSSSSLQETLSLLSRL